VGPITALVVALVIVAISAVIVWLVSDAADDWMVNVATDAFAIALTIGVIDRIFQRQARERVQPRVERALSATGQALQSFVNAVAHDYVQTHVTTYRPLPSDSLEMLDQWVADYQPRKDSPSLAELDGGAPQLLGEAAAMGDSLRTILEQGRDVLEPDLIAAMDDYIVVAPNAHLYLSIWNPNSVGGDLLLETLVSLARAVLAALLRSDESWRPVPDGMLKSAERLHSELLKRASEADGS
jgi:hypothetical protein